MKTFSLGCVLGVSLWLACIHSNAQIAPARTLEQLKAETQDRANRNAYPLAELDAEGAREALSHLNSLDHDDWAKAWTPIGDQHMRAGKALESKNKEQAAHEYEKALQYYLFARFPVEDTPETEKAYALAREAFKQFARLVDPPFEVMSFQFEGQTVTGYLRKPKGVAKPPVVITVGGLDSRKESNAIREGEYLKHGVAFLSMDMPGTGENKIKIQPGAERVFSVAIDEIKKRADLDGSRIVVFGGSWGGHWSARVGFTEKDRLKGVVVQAGPVHEYFQPEWQRKALGNTEYLFGLFQARAAIYGVKTLDDFLAYGPKMSIKDEHWLDKPSAPMLLVNGAKDTQVPIEDLFLLLRSGSPKEVWFNPDGGHMGRSKTLKDEEIFKTVTLPWIVKKLKS
jgi:pimeloyl-ACP methyl ester carboxylesterase